jgi:hypothetical protein
VVIGVLESAQVVCFAVAAAVLRERVRGTRGQLALFVIFPVTFFGANFGAGAAVIIGLHAQHTTQLLVTLTTLASIGCAAVLIRLAAAMLPAPAARPEPARATASGRAGRLAGLRTAR